MSDGRHRPTLSWEESWSVIVAVRIHCDTVWLSLIFTLFPTHLYYHNARCNLLSLWSRVDELFFKFPIFEA